MPSKPDPSTQPILEFLEQPDFISLLEDWAGETIFQRGVGYFGKKKVSDLVITKDGKLLASVHGSRNYVTALYLDDGNQLESACTCPYGDVCKHVVALTLMAREALLEKKALPECDEFDFRSEKLKEMLIKRAYFAKCMKITKFS